MGGVEKGQTVQMACIDKDVLLLPPTQEQRLGAVASIGELPGPFQPALQDVRAGHRPVA